MFRVVFLMSVAACLPVSASANVHANPFANWVSLVKHMRSVGIEQSQVNWPVVEQVCAPFLEHGQESYNRCRFEKAEVNALHTADRRECRTIAKADADIVTRRSHRRFSRRIISDRSDRIAAYQPRRLNLPQRNRQKRAGVVECMQNLGWASASNWRLGQR